LFISDLGLRPRSKDDDDDDDFS